MVKASNVVSLPEKYLYCNYYFSVLTYFTVIHFYTQKKVHEL